MVEKESLTRSMRIAPSIREIVSDLVCSKWVLLFSFQWRELDDPQFLNYNLECFEVGVTKNRSIVDLTRSVASSSLPTTNFNIINSYDEIDDSLSTSMEYYFDSRESVSFEVFNKLLPQYGFNQNIQKLVKLHVDPR